MISLFGKKPAAASATDSVQPQFVKSDIEDIRFDIEAGGQCALSMMICRDGTVGRKGSGSVPAPSTTVLGMADADWFSDLLASIDERVFSKAGVYDLPDKSGIPVMYKVAFLGGPTASRSMLYGFGFKIGSEGSADGSLLPYFDRLIGQAVRLTEIWYTTQLARQSNSPS